MKLLVDLGNSQLKWAFGTAAGLLAVGDASHGAEPELAAIFRAGYAPDEIRVANVAGDAAGARLAEALRAHFGLTPSFARSAPGGAGVRSGYADPAQLGIDRWLAICAAFAQYRGALCVVDTGTATTIDLVNGAGDHEGGLILPGMTLMQSALLGNTANLARLSSGGPASVQGPGTRAITLGRDTAAAIQHGAVEATACLVQACLGVPPGTDGSGRRLLVLTGGSGPLLKAAVLRKEGGIRLEYRPHLVLEGLALDPPCYEVAA